MKFQVKILITILLFLFLITGCSNFKVIEVPPSASTFNSVGIGGRNVTWTLLDKNMYIDGDVLGALMTNPPNAEVPHFWIQTGGSSQASGVARSFMIVNEDISILNSTNRTSCIAWAESFDKELLIDCNTTTTGADLLVGDDLQVFGTIETQEYEPDTYEIVKGAYLSGNVSSLVNMMGDDLVVSETSGAPGFDIRFNITLDEEAPPKYFVARWRYDGGSGHECAWQVYDYETANWDSLKPFSDDGTFYNSMLMLRPNHILGKFVDSNNTMQIRAYHISSGINSHDIHIDYVGVKY